MAAVQPALFVPALKVVMNTVPLEKQGQAGGIVLTSQILGGTVGMAATGTLLVQTGSFQLVFLLTALLALLVLGLVRSLLDQKSGTVTN